MDYDDLIKQRRNVRQDSASHDAEEQQKLSQIFRAQVATSGPEVAAFLRKHRVDKWPIGEWRAPVPMSNTERFKPRGMEWRLPMKDSDTHGLFVDESGRWWVRAITRTVKRKGPWESPVLLKTFGASQGESLNQLEFSLNVNKPGYDGSARFEIHRLDDHRALSFHVGLDGRVGVQEFLETEPWQEWLVAKLDRMT